MVGLPTPSQDRNKPVDFSIRTHHRGTSSPAERRGFLGEHLPDRLQPFSATSIPPQRGGGANPQPSFSPGLGGLAKSRQFLTLAGEPQYRQARKVAPMHRGPTPLWPHRHYGAQDSSRFRPVASPRVDATPSQLPGHRAQMTNGARSPRARGPTEGQLSGAIMLVITPKLSLLQHPPLCIFPYPSHWVYGPSRAASRAFALNSIDRGRQPISARQVILRVSRGFATARGLRC